MVKFRGININVVSQIDAQRLPEYSTAHTYDTLSNLGSVAACYIPIHPGSQIWFEYSVDGPHPPNAAYLFKLFMDRQFVTSWDCTAKYDHHGKAVYSLHVVQKGCSGLQSIIHHSFAFTGASRKQSPSMKDDCLEVRVYRIQKRRRVRELTIDTSLPKTLQVQTQGRLMLSNRGLIEFERPARRYQYLLIDPQDEPYAGFRFYCRTQDYLQEHQILDLDRSLSPTSPTSSDAFHLQTDSSAQGQDVYCRADADSGKPTKPLGISHHNQSIQSSLVSSRSSVDVTTLYHPTSQVLPVSGNSVKDFLFDDSHSSESTRMAADLVTDHASKTTVESLTKEMSPSPPQPLQVRTKQNSEPTSSVTGKEIIISSPTDIVQTPRSSSSPPQKVSNPADDHHRSDQTATSTTNIPQDKLELESEHQAHRRSSLRLIFNNAPFNSAHDHPPSSSRPLSPFTRGGFLRRLGSAPSPQLSTSPPNNAEPSLRCSSKVGDKSKDATVSDTKEEIIDQENDQSVKPTTAIAMFTHRGRHEHSFMGFLGRTTGRRAATR